MGLLGAAVSRVAVMVLGCGVPLYFIRGYLKGAAGFGFPARAAISSAVPAVVVFILSTSVSAKIITLLPYTLLGLPLFLACTRLLRLLSPGDKSYLSHLLPAGPQWVTRIL